MSVVVTATILVSVKRFLQGAGEYWDRCIVGGWQQEEGSLGSLEYSPKAPGEERRGTLCR